MPRVLLTLAFVAVAYPASAQQLTLQLKDGRVTLEATGVPVRQILAEWARVGGTKIVGGDKITGSPVTLHISNMPERQALDIILRNVAGFMAAPRLAAATPGASAYDRILILATTSTPAPVAATNGRGSTTTAAGRRLPPRPPNLPPSPADNDNVVEEPVQANDDPADTGVNQQPVFTFPAPPGTTNGAGAVFQPVQMGPPFGRPGQPGTAAPVITLQPNANGQPAIYNFVPADPNAQQPAVGQPVVPGSPFNVIGSPSPGMIQQPPPPPAPGQRPPGQD